jgi:hypothetical protein
MTVAWVLFWTLTQTQIVMDLVMTVFLPLSVLIEKYVQLTSIANVIYEYG